MSVTEGKEQPQSRLLSFSTSEGNFFIEDCSYQGGDRNRWCEHKEDYSTTDSNSASEEFFDAGSFLNTRETPETTPESSDPDCKRCDAQTYASRLMPAEDLGVSLHQADALPSFRPSVKVEDSQEGCILEEWSGGLQPGQQEVSWVSGSLNLRLDTASVLREWSVLGGGGSAGRLFQGGACVTVDQLDLSAWQPKQQGSYAPVAHQMRVQCTAERIMPMIPTPPFCDPLQWGNQSGLVEGIAHVLGQPINMPLAADTERQCRALSLERYREKKRNRAFSKTIRYEMRKLNAERRPRVKGRFVKRSTDNVPLILQGRLQKRSTEHILPRQCFLSEDDPLVYEFDFMPEC